MGEPASPGWVFIAVVVVVVMVLVVQVFIIGCSTLYIVGEFLRSGRRHSRDCTMSENDWDCLSCFLLTFSSWRIRCHSETERFFTERTEILNAEPSHCWDEQPALGLLFWSSHPGRLLPSVLWGMCTVQSTMMMLCRWEVKTYGLCHLQIKCLDDR